MPSGREHNREMPDAEPTAIDINVRALPRIARSDLERMGLVAPGDTVRMSALSGGVSSDIFKVETGGRCFVIKRALARLRVADVWEAPTARNRHEANWLETAAGIVPGAVPVVLARDDDSGLFAMEYFDPRSFPVWKERLLHGDVDLEFAAEVGRRLAAIHGGTAGDATVAARFATDTIFHAIRLEPYFETAARRHPEVRDELVSLSRRTLDTKAALVHGDVSPKNILVGKGGPVFLDAECAWYGDPAFDVAFCLNHLLLKCLWSRAAAPRLTDAFESLAASYGRGVSWEEREAIERRTAALLPALMLARVDGKSPVEYLDEPGRSMVRETAVSLILTSGRSPFDIATAWGARLGI
jgi:aminoglycoside phosphotransferase (APT) family kinase protein